MSHDDFAADHDEHLVPFEDAYREGFARLALATPPAPRLPETIEPSSRDRRWMAVLAVAAVLSVLVGVGVSRLDQRPISPASPQHTSSAPSSATNPSPTMTPAELQLAKDVAIAALAGPDAVSSATARATKSTYGEFFRIADPSDTVEIEGLDQKQNEPILVVLVSGILAPAGSPAPSEPSPSASSVFVVVEAAAIHQSHQISLTMGPASDQVMNKFPGPVVPLDLTK